MSPEHKKHKLITKFEMPDTEQPYRPKDGKLESTMELSQMKQAPMIKKKQPDNKKINGKKTKGKLTKELYDKLWTLVR
jgi:hypothetical protein